MRVITGKARGIQLKTPHGMLTRPTADRVKEALFSIIRLDIAGANVLDLFGGTGQLGIEALSRGAKRCVFLDASREAIQIVLANCKTAGAGSSRMMRSTFWPPRRKSLILPCWTRRTTTAR